MRGVGQAFFGADRIEAIDEVLDVGVAVAVQIRGRVGSILGIKAVPRLPLVGHAVVVRILVGLTSIFGITADLLDVRDDPQRYLMDHLVHLFLRVVWVGELVSHVRPSNSRCPSLCELFR